MLANAALFAALADLIGAYGEDAVAKMTNGLSRRVHPASSHSSARRNSSIA
jgi:hypothetical protein